MEWITCHERMPPEHPSIFAKYFGTDKWSNAMFRNTSDRVLVTVEKSGQRIVTTASTHDGRFSNTDLYCGNAIAWMPLPEPYSGD